MALEGLNPPGPDEFKPVGDAPGWPWTPGPDEFKPVGDAPGRVASEGLTPPPSPLPPRGRRHASAAAAARPPLSRHEALKPPAATRIPGLSRIPGPSPRTKPDPRPITPAPPRGWPTWPDPPLAGRGGGGGGHGMAKHVPQAGGKSPRAEALRERPRVPKPLPLNSFWAVLGPTKRPKGTLALGAGRPGTSPGCLSPGGNPLVLKYA